MGSQLGEMMTHDSSTRRPAAVAQVVAGLLLIVIAVWVVALSVLQPQTVGAQSRALDVLQTTPTPIVSEESEEGEEEAPLEPTAAPTTAATVVPTIAPPVLPQATAAPARPASPTKAAPELPETSIATPTIGVFLGMGGLALALRGARRIRSASADLAESTNVRSLERLAKASAHLQHSAVASATEMEAQGRHLEELLDDLDTR